MRLAVLGIDDDVLRLVHWATEHGGHELIAAYVAEDRASELRAIAPFIRFSDNWEELLSGPTVDAVLVASAKINPSSGSASIGFEERGDQLRRLVQAGLAMVVACPACEAIVGFEVEMICRDTRAMLVPYFPGAFHPAIEKLRSLVALGSESAIGRVEQVVLEREQADRGRPTVLTVLSRDIGLARQMIGRVQTVSAAGSAAKVGRDPLGPKPKELPALSNLNVSLGGLSGLVARWSIAPSVGQPRVRLSLVGERGKAVLTMPAAGDWSLDIAGDAFSTEVFSPDDDLPQVFLRLAEAMQSDAAADGAWLAACRDQEATESVDRSLIRGRTIELFHEEHTEAASFKSIMAMGGCLLLVLAVCVVLLASVVEGLQLPLRNLPAWRMWPLYLLALIGAFLLLQILSLALKRTELKLPEEADSAG
jgi:predicted dehydrogenase